MKFPYQKSWTFLMAAAITAIVHGILVTLNVIGDKSVFYVLICAFILGVNFLASQILYKAHWLRFITHAITGFFLGALIGYFGLCIDSSGCFINPITLITTPDRGFLNALIGYLLLSTSLFGVTFSSVLWLLQKGSIERDGLKS